MSENMIDRTEINLLRIKNDVEKLTRLNRAEIGIP